MLSIREVHNFCLLYFVVTILFIGVSLVLALPVMAEQVDIQSKPEFVPHLKRALDLSKVPTTKELMAAGKFGGTLRPTHSMEEGTAMSDAINLSFGRAMKLWNSHQYKEGAAQLRQHMVDFPDSPWAAEAILHAGCEARFNGRYTESEAHFQWVLDHTKNKTHIGAVLLNNKAKQRLAIQRAMEGNLAESRAMFTELIHESPDWRIRTYARSFLGRLSRLRVAGLKLYNCGVKALASILEKEGKVEEAYALMMMEPLTDQGFNMMELKDLAEKYGYQVTGLKLSTQELNDIPLPAIVQLSPKKKGNRGHYWVLKEIRDNRLALHDIQNLNVYYQSPEEFAKEWDGHALVFSKKGSLPGVVIADKELGKLFGGCCGVPTPADKGKLGEPECTEKMGGGSGADASGGGHSISKSGTCGKMTAYGSPVWTVNALNMNMFMRDIPLWSKSPVGPSVEVDITYNSQTASNQFELFGNKWAFKYASYLVLAPGDDVTVFMPDGKELVFYGEYIPGSNLTNPGHWEYYPGAGNTNSLKSYVENDWVPLRDQQTGDLWALQLWDNSVYLYGKPRFGGLEVLDQYVLLYIQDNQGNVVAINYDANGRLASITDAMGATTTLTYNTGGAQDGLVSAVTGPNGRSANFQYDNNRNLTYIEDMGGYWTRLNYDADINITSMENELGITTFYQELPDGINNDGVPYPPPGGDMWESYRMTVTDPNGASSEYFYKATSNFTNEAWYVSPNHWTPYVDASNNNMFAKKTRYLYVYGGGELAANVGEVRYPDGKLRVEVGRTNGFVTRQTIVASPSIDTQILTLNSREHVKTIDFPEGKRITTIYLDNIYPDVVKDSQTQATIDYDYIIETINKDYAGDAYKFVLDHRLDKIYKVEKITVTDPLVDTGKDPLDPTRSDPRVSVTRFTYDTSPLSGSYGRPVTITNPLGVDTQIVYNPTGTIQSLVNTVGTMAEFLYDTYGRISTIKDNFGDRETNYQYNDLNMIKKVLYSDGSFVHLNYATCCPGRIVQVTDQTGNKTTYEYNLYNQTAIVNANGERLQMNRDRNGNIVQFVDSLNRSTEFVYDDLNRLTEKIYADGSSISMDYDDYSRVSKVTNARGITATYLYDKEARITSIDYSDTTPDMTLTYDDHNRTVTKVDGVGTWAYTVNDAGQPESVKDPRLNSPVRYEYDVGGRLAVLRQSTDTDWTGVMYTYDDQNMLTKVETGDSCNPNCTVRLTHKYSYFPPPYTYKVQSLERSTMANPGQVDMSTSYFFLDLNDNNWLSSIKSEVYDKVAGSLVSRPEFDSAYERNSDGLTLSETINIGSPADWEKNSTTTYTHNNLDQVTQTSAHPDSLLYDDDGNLIQGHTPDGYLFSAAYDALNRLTSLRYTDSGSVEHLNLYEYGGNGFLASIVKKEDGVTVDHKRLIRAGLKVIQERDASNVTNREYAWSGSDGGTGGLLSMKEGSTYYSYIHDGRGNVRAVLSDELTNRREAGYQYDAFGKKVDETGTTPSIDQPYGFSSKRYDMQTGLIYYGYRFYSPYLGTWLSRDPIGGANLYSFNRNSPMNYIDPDGRRPFPHYNRTYVPNQHYGENTIYGNRPAFRIPGRYTIRLYARSGVGTGSVMSQYEKQVQALTTTGTGEMLWETLFGGNHRANLPEFSDMRACASDVENLYKANKARQMLTAARTAQSVAGKSPYTAIIAIILEVVTDLYIGPTSSNTKDLQKALIDSYIHPGQDPSIYYWDSGA